MEWVTRSWWAVALRGVLAVGFGLAALVWPKSTVLAFGAVLIGIGLWSRRIHQAVVTSGTWP